MTAPEAKPSCKSGPPSFPKTTAWHVSCATDPSPPIPPAVELPPSPPQRKLRTCSYAHWQTELLVSLGRILGTLEHRFQSRRAVAAGSGLSAVATGLRAFGQQRELPLQ